MNSNIKKQKDFIKSRIEKIKQTNYSKVIDYIRTEPVEEFELNGRICYQMR